MPRRVFEEVVLPHLDAAFNYARWLTKSDADAEDVVQDEAVRALRFFSSLLKDDLPDEQLNPEALVIQRQAVERVQHAIEGLPVDFREVILLRELEGLSYKEIAAIVGVPIGTVMSRLARGRERLLALLDPE